MSDVQLGNSGSASGSAGARNLAYYLAHPDEMPEDPKEIERLTMQHMDDAIETGKEQMTVDRFVQPADKDEKADSSTAKGDPEAEAQAKADADKATVKAEAEAAVAAQVAKDAADKAAGNPDAKPDGILAKDGKNVIPYSQLESARARATAAETLAKEQADEIARLRADKAKPAADDVQTLSDEELTALEADSPTLAKTLRSQQAAIARLDAQVREVTAVSQTQLATQEAAVKSDIQSAIDANPLLAEWQTAEDQTMWTEAARFDKALRESPRYANATFAERFAKVVELTQAATGTTPEKPAPVTETLPTLTTEQIKAAAAAKLKTKAQVPVSLSQIPGGAPPAVDERQKVEEMSSVALGQQFLSMSKEQMDAYLSSL